jgi:hypothetical protein
MARYHLNAHDVITRAKGDKIVRVAAYAARTKLRDDRYGVTYDFSRRPGLVFAEIMAPTDAPDWARDREAFWNAVEKAEKRKDSQLGIPYDIALPHELTLEQNIALIRDYCQKEFLSRGLVVDVAIHEPDPDKDQRNIHAHILIPTRPVDENGFTKKQRTADSKKSWEQERKENIVRLRKSWAETHNLHIDAAGFDSSHHIDHRSLEEQGIDREPTRHRGAASDHMEERGIATDRGDDHRNIEAENQKRALRKRKRRDYAEAPEAASMPDSGSTDDKIAADAKAKEQKRQEEAAKQEQDRQDEAGKEQARRQQAFIDEDKLLKELGQQFRERQIQLVEEMRREQERIDALKKDPERIDSHFVELERTTEGHRQAFIDRDEKKYLEGDIRDPGARYAQALTQHYTYINPYESFAKVAMAEHNSFRTDQEILASSIAKATDPKEREMLQTRKLIEAYDYLMITGERIAKMSEILSGELVKGEGRLESKESKRIREQINGKDILDKNDKKIGFEDGYKQKAQALREHYRELQAQMAPTKERVQPQSAAEKIVADAKRETQAPSTKLRPAPDKYKPLKPKTQEEMDREKQQELERKAQQDRERGR